MNWTEGPATWKQLRYLSQHGYKPDKALTKAEASTLIRQFGGNPDAFSIVTESPAPELVKDKFSAFDLRLAVEQRKRALAAASRWDTEKSKREHDLALSARQQFWVHTCSEPEKARDSVIQAQALYRQEGCRFAPPANNQVQYILEALDRALPQWDKDQPELFFRTLELNFPEMLRKR